VARLGQRVRSDDATKATRKNGSAQRTEWRMMGSIPLAEWKFAEGSPRQIAVLVASASTQNKRHELIALCNSLKLYRPQLFIISA
jgi:hypothetical protein